MQHAAVFTLFKQFDNKRRRRRRRRRRPETIPSRTTITKEMRRTIFFLYGLLLSIGLVAVRSFTAISAQKTIGGISPTFQTQNENCFKFTLYLSNQNEEFHSSEKSLTNEEISRYSRHLVLADVGMDGQKALKNSSVLVIGAGGLGSPCLL